MEGNQVSWFRRQIAIDKRYRKGKHAISRINFTLQRSTAVRTARKSSVSYNDRMGQACRHQPRARNEALQT
jgi:hypothetical protein